MPGGGTPVRGHLGTMARRHEVDTGPYPGGVTPVRGHLGTMARRHEVDTGPYPGGGHPRERSPGHHGEAP